MVLENKWKNALFKFVFFKLIYKDKVFTIYLINYEQKIYFYWITNMVIGDNETYSHHPDTLEMFYRRGHLKKYVG